MADEKQMTEEERMAAEWEAASAAEASGGGDAAAAGAGDGAAAPGAAADAGGGSDARVLSQDEIDSLLGFDGGNKGSGSNSGIQAIINSSLVSYERLPMLEVVFDRLVRVLTTSLRNFTSDNV